MVNYARILVGLSHGGQSFLDSHVASFPNIELVDNYSEMLARVEAQNHYAYIMELNLKNSRRPVFPKATDLGSRTRMLDANSSELEIMDYLSPIRDIFEIVRPRIEAKTAKLIGLANSPFIAGWANGYGIPCNIKRTFNLEEFLSAQQTVRHLSPTSS